MSGDPAERLRTLENQFFHEVDRQLLLRIRAQQVNELQKEALRGATGIADRALLDELVKLGVSAENRLAVALFPLVHVAWSDGHVSPRERNAILQAARQSGCDSDSPADRLLQTWLGNAPQPGAFLAWRAYVNAVRGNLTSESKEALRKELLDYALTVAQAAGGILGLASISPQEQRALDEIASVLEC